MSKVAITLTVVLTLVVLTIIIAYAVFKTKTTVPIETTITHGGVAGLAHGVFGQGLFSTFA